MSDILRRIKAAREKRGLESNADGQPSIMERIEQARAKRQQQQQQPQKIQRASIVAGKLSAQPLQEVEVDEVQVDSPVEQKPLTRQQIINEQFASGRFGGVPAAKETETETEKGERELRDKAVELFDAKGMMAGQDPVKVAQFIGLSSVTDDPEELVAIFKNTFPEIRSSMASDGRVFFENPNNPSQRVELNKPGLSKQDVFTALGLTSAFTPAGALATGAKTLGKAAAIASASSAGTQALIEGAQATSGGEFSAENVAFEGVMGAVPEVVSNALGRYFGRSPVPEGLADEITAAIKRQGDAAASNPIPATSSNPAPATSSNPAPATSSNPTQEATVSFTPKKGDEALLSKDAQQAQQLFERQGVEPSLGDLTKSVKDQKAEDALYQGSGDGAQDFINFRARQSEKIINNINKIKRSLPEVDDGLIRRALIKSKESGDKAASELYTKFAQKAEEIGDIPLITERVLGPMPSGNKLEGLLNKMDDKSANALEDVFLRYGLVDLPDGAAPKNPTASLLRKSLGADASRSRELTVTNINEFRAELNDIAENTTTRGATEKVIAPLRRSLDSELELLMSSAGDSGQVELGAFGKAATSAFRQHRQRFSKDSILGKLTSNKGDRVTQKIADQETFKKLVNFNSRTRTKEELGDVFSVLRQSDDGKKAVQGFQNQLIGTIFEEAHKGSVSNKVGNVQQFNPNQVKKLLDGVGKEELDIIFKDNPKALKDLRENIEIGIRAKTDEAIKGKGSTIAVRETGRNIVNALSGIPGLGSIGLLAKAGLTQAEKISKDSAQKSSLLAATRPDIEIQKATARAIKNQFKALKADKRAEVREVLKNYPTLGAYMGVKSEMLNEDSPTNESGRQFQAKLDKMPFLGINFKTRGQRKKSNKSKKPINF